MSSLIHQLNNEALLVMYLADELPREDRAEVERMLAGDAGMRGQLEQLSAAYTGANDAIRSADEHERLLLPANVAARRVGQAARSWHARSASAAAAERQGRGRRRFPFWAYPITAAAAIVLAAISFWWFQAGRGPLRLDPLGPTVNTSLESDDSVAVVDEQPVVPSPLYNYPDVADPHDAAIDQVEDELYAMIEPTDEARGILTLDETDAQ